MSEASASAKHIELAAEIVAAYVSSNSVPATELPALINSVFAALTQAVAGKTEEKAEKKEPAVPVKRSVTPDYIICLDDGKKFKSLKRHLRTEHGMTPEQYRAKWGLPSSYPMLAPNYAKTRSELARALGLGQRRGKSVTPVTAAAVAAPAKPQRTAARVAAPAKGRRSKKTA